jgi:hypothetical protein
MITTHQRPTRCGLTPHAASQKLRAINMNISRYGRRRGGVRRESVVLGAALYCFARTEWYELNKSERQSRAPSLARSPRRR